MTGSFDYIAPSALNQVRVRFARMGSLVPASVGGRFGSLCFLTRRKPTDNKLSASTPWVNSNQKSDRSQIKSPHIGGRANVVKTTLALPPAGSQIFKLASPATTLAKLSPYYLNHDTGAIL